LALPKPAPGQVIHYSYLWSEEYERGRDEGSKDRPCVIVVAVDKDVDGLDIVIVLPITHSPPSLLSEAVEIPNRTKVRLGLDDERSWVVLTEANRFRWPGPDLRPVPRAKPRSMIYGLLPETLFNLIQSRFSAALRAKRLSLVPRSE
jgi:hypothetical protein